MKDKAFLGASLLAALAASFCCILPIVFALAGMGMAGASAVFAAWRPYLLALTFALLGIGFYLSYRKRRKGCEPGSACELPAVNRSGRVGLWLAAVLVILFAAFPYYSGPIARLLLSDGKAQAQPASTLEHVTFAVEGMTCPVCAEGVAHKLKELPGVRQATVSYEQHKAEIEYDWRRVPRADTVLKSVKELCSLAASNDDSGVANTLGEPTHEQEIRSRSPRYRLSCLDGGVEVPGSSLASGNR